MHRFGRQLALIWIGLAWSVAPVNGSTNGTAVAEGIASTGTPVEVDADTDAASVREPSAVQAPGQESLTAQLEEPSAGGRDRDAAFAPARWAKLGVMVSAADFEGRSLLSV